MQIKLSVTFGIMRYGICNVVLLHFLSKVNKKINKTKIIGHLESV